ncbi:hypothetical protein ACT453_18845, partial [Bacillus sp. D-CC]
MEFFNSFVDKTVLERVAVLEHLEMVAETKEELLVKNGSTVKRERKQAKTTPDTQEIYKQLQLALVGGNSEKNNEEISLD